MKLKRLGTSSKRKSVRKSVGVRSISKRTLDELQAAQYAILHKLESQQSLDDFESMYEVPSVDGELKILKPPYSPSALTSIVEESNTLPQCIAAITTNAYIGGYRLEYTGRSGESTTPESADNRATIKDFMDNPNGEYSIEELNKRLGVDKHTTGNGYIEVCRDRMNNPSTLYHVKSYQMRLTHIDPEPVAISISVRRGSRIVEQIRKQYFRRYVQLVQCNGVSKKVYFKEFGDPRVIDPDTGKVTSKSSKNKAKGATEIIHYKQYHPMYSYGVPAWISQLPSILGVRQSEIVNLDFFNNNAIPAMAILVAGGYLTEEAIDELESIFSDKKGRDSMHNIAIIEATGDDVSASEDGRIAAPHLEMRSLGDARQGDQIFGEYNKSCQTKIRSSLRLPPLVIGLSDDYNYACYDDQTEFLSNKGWMKFDNWEEGIKVAAYNKGLGKLVYETPENGLIQYEIDDELIHFNNEYTDIMVTKNHRMFYRSFFSKEFCTDKASEMSATDTVVVKSLVSDYIDAGSTISEHVINGHQSKIVNYVGSVYCFTVPSGLIVTRRNGKVAIQGNSANVSAQMADSQVYGPERSELNKIYNDKILKDLAIDDWKVRFITPRVVGIIETIRSLKVINDMGGMTPNLAIQFANELFNLNIPFIEGEWGNYPYELVKELNKKGELKGIEDMRIEPAEVAEVTEKIESGEITNDKDSKEQLAKLISFIS